MAQVSIEHLKRLKTGVILHYLPAGDGTEYNGETNIPEMDMGEEASRPAWQILAQTSEFTPGEEVNTEDVTFMSAVSKTKRKETTTTIDADTFEAKVIDWSPYMLGLKFRIKEPLVAGKFIPTHQKSSPYSTAWLKIEHWSDDGALIYTEYKYAKIRISANDAENMTLVQPTISGEELESAYNGNVFTTASGVPEPTPEGT